MLKLRFFYSITQRFIHNNVLSAGLVSVTDTLSSLFPNIVQAHNCLPKERVTGVNVAELFCQVFSFI